MLSAYSSDGIARNGASQTGVGANWFGFDSSINPFRAVSGGGGYASLNGSQHGGSGAGGRGDGLNGGVLGGGGGAGGASGGTGGIGGGGGGSSAGNQTSSGTGGQGLVIIERIG